MARGVGLLASVLVTSCASVPEVTFESDAATVETSDAAADGMAGADSMGPADGASGLDATNDATPPPQDGAAPMEGGSDDAGCPSAPPVGASVCCGPVACRGDATACQSECTNCENDCAGQTCCLDKHGNYQGCAASPARCP